MLVLVKQPSSVILEMEVSEKADGLECLEKVCKKLGIIEVDYFGFQFICNKGERLWLNLRNPIERQLPGSPPYRLQLRVKFYIKPHQIQQSTTREQFYLNVKQDFIDEKLRFISEEENKLVPEIAGLIAQVELGDYIKKDPTQIIQYENIVPQSEDFLDFMPKLVKEHRKLKNISRESAHYRLLQMVSNLSCYGIEYHELQGEKGAVDHIGVGPEGIATYDSDWNLQDSMIDYKTIQKATVNGRVLSLHLISDEGETDIVEKRLVTPRAASALYRSVTEMYSFYRCDTVRDVVATQFSFDIKGALVSIFNEHTTLGKKYVFDIRRTYREAHDHARRVLFALENAVDTDDNESGDEESEAEIPLTSVEECAHCKADAKCESCKAKQCSTLKETVEKIQDSFTCQCCADAAINTVFIPCGHFVCCSDCSSKVDNCPLCRSDIQQAHPVFLPDIPVPIVSASRAIPSV